MRDFDLMFSFGGVAESTGGLGVIGRDGWVGGVLVIGLVAA